MKKLSFIIPVYNVEKYIARCLDSVVTQNISPEDYEIIVVNDGSPDNSADIVRDYTNRYENIILVEKENGGLSSARNYGIEYCKGKYIWMIDSDDTIQENCLKELLQYAEANNLDFVSIPIIDNFLNTNEKVLSNVNNKPVNQVVNNIEYLDKFAVEHSGCTFIVRRECFKETGVRFIEGITQEDFEFVLRLLEHCHRISSYQDKGGLYIYNVGREGSITTVMNEKKYLKTLDSFFISIDNLQKKYPKTGNKKDYRYYVQRYIDNLKCYALSYLLYFPLPYQTRKEYFEKYKQIDAYNIRETRFLSWKVTGMSYLYRRPFIFNKALYLVSKIT